MLYVIIVARYSELVILDNLKGSNLVSVETIKQEKEFEQIIPYEIERKFVPVFPESLEPFRENSRPIEQYYLSNPKEPFSLRFRETLTADGGLVYEATLKDSGIVDEDGVRRLEVTTSVDEALYQYYRSEETPLVRKLRAEPRPGITIDYYEDGSVQVESEDEAEWLAFRRDHGDAFAEVTGDTSSTNEWKAHLSFRHANDGREALPMPTDLKPDDIVNDIVRQSQTPSVVHIGGRSGSGKSTIVREVQQKLERIGLTSVVMSTDEYHRGATWLREYNGGEPWTHWDDEIVYDTQTMAADLARLLSGQAIHARGIDWTVAEPVITGVINPVDVIIIEGIYAQSPDITRETDLSYEMTTPLATCVGRRLLRDLVERPQFADPAASLSYMLREAEPAYRLQRSGREEV